MTPPPLAGRVALVTGGGRGIGRAIASALADAGAAVAILARTEKEIRETATAINNGGGRAIALAADVMDRGSVRGSVADIERRLGPVDVLVNNAGVSGPDLPFWETDPDEWWRTLEVNLRGPMLVTRAVLPSMIARRSGTVVNVGSYASIRRKTARTLHAYATSKAALVRFSDALAAQTNDYGVRIFTISPGLVHTAMTEGMDLFRSAPQTAWARPEAAASLVVRLAAEPGTALNGRFIHVNDDLDELRRESARIDSENLYTLRLVDLRGVVE